jgi:hypothetical protein
MSSSTIVRRAATSIAVMSIAVGAAAAPAHAQDLVFPSCPGFDVGLTIESGAGNPIQVGPRAVLAAGTFRVTLENVRTGTTYSARTAGAGRARPGPNGSTIFTNTGPNLLFLFATDPGGPSTTLYLGRLVLNQSADEVTTINSSTGGTVDVCAALGG